MTKTLILYLNETNLEEIGAVQFLYNEMKKSAKDVKEHQYSANNKVLQYQDGDLITMSSLPAVMKNEKYDFVYIPASTAQTLIKVADQFLKKTQFTDSSKQIKQFAVVNGQIIVI